MSTYSLPELRLKMRLLRNFCGYSQQEIADNVNISQPAYFKIESGNTQITLLHLIDFAESIGISLNDMVTLSFDDILQLTTLKKHPRHGNK